MLHRYACYYIHADTGERSTIYCESVKEYKPGEEVPALFGNKIVIDFEITEGSRK